MKRLVARFVKDKSGATAVEYGLLAMLIAVAIIGIAKSVGTSNKATFTRVNNGLASH